MTREFLAAERRGAGRLALLFLGAALLSGLVAGSVFGLSPWLAMSGYFAWCASMFFAAYIVLGYVERGTPPS